MELWGTVGNGVLRRRGAVHDGRRDWKGKQSLRRPMGDAVSASG